MSSSNLDDTRGNPLASVGAGHDAVISAFGPSGGQAASTVVDAARAQIAGLTQAGG
jgi:putative NADH-flavin reductase